MNAQKRLPINALGAEFKKTKSEKAFKEIYERLREGVIKYYSNFGKDHQIVEDAYNEAMISFWVNIDKLDIENYSVSTNIYLKTSQSIMKQNSSKIKTTGEGDETIYKSKEEQASISNHNSSNIVVGKHGKYVDAINTKVSESYEDEYIKREDIKLFWNVIRSAKFYDIIYDHYYNGLKYKELATKYEVDIQIVKNRIFHGKKQIKELLKKEYEEISKIFD